MNLGNKISVKELYNYSVQHNCIESEVNIVLNRMRREGNLFRHFVDSTISPVNSMGTIDFGDKIEYSTQDVLNLLS